MSGGAEYQFVAWTRSGISALLAGAAQPATVDLGANGQVTAQLATYGAADVAGLDARAVIRTVPRDGTHDFEPNLFPSVELAHPALPWLVSGPADAVGRAMPWIALIVVEDGPGVTLASDGLSLAAPASPANELPPLAQAWAWAHAQTLSTAGAALDTAALATSSGGSRARLIAPRQLVPATKYIACIVPTTPAWTGAEISIRLAVYYAWRFSTGPNGDFASLVRRLQPQTLDASVGHRAVDISTPEWGAPTTTGVTLDVSSALRSPVWTPPQPPAWAAAIGAAIAGELASAAAPPSGQPPELAPPSYGSAATRIATLASAPTWQVSLNADVAQRIAASAGADVIRGDVDTFVDAAWRSAGDTERINGAIRGAELAGTLAQRLGDKHLGALTPDGELLAIVRPLAARMKVEITAEPSATLAATITASAMPRTALSASLRRLGRTGGTVARVAATTTGDLLARIDAKQITGDPPKTLAASAAGFDTVSISAQATVRLALATPTLVASAAVQWNASTTVVVKPAATATVLSKPATATTVAAKREIAVATAVAKPVVTEKPATTVPVVATVRGTPLPVGEIGTIPKLISTETVFVNDIDEFAAAARAHQQYITTHLDAILDTRPPLGDLTAARPLGAIRASIVAQWSPARGILPILGARITGVAVAGFAPIVATPVLQQPMIQTLATRSPELVMPGFTSLLANRVALAATDPDFVRAFLVGANEQLARELLWRRFPGALGHTWLQTFWGRVEAAADGSPERVPDVPPIETWPAAGPPAAPDTLVLAVRGDALQRYPNALVYAVAAAWQGTQRVIGTVAPIAPVIALTLGTDVALYGFDLALDVARGTSTPTGAAGYYFVIAEHPHEPRFGLAASAIPNPTSWSDIAWSDVVAGDLAGRYLRVDGPLAQRALTSNPNLRWGADSAQLAAITLRPTMRVAIHASTLM